jgi:hypothetical protein
MSSGMKQLILVGLFAGLVGGVLVYRVFLSGNEAEEELDPAVALERYGFYLREVSKKCGIDFVHRAPELDAKLGHIMPIAATMGAAVSVVDVDGDGLPDLYVINSGPNSKNCLYRNKGDGTFEEVAEMAGIADLNRPEDGACMGAIWGDFDNDGYEDVLIYRWGKPALFRNRGKDKSGKWLGFEDVTAQANLPTWVNANAAVWLDYNRDGNLDLFLTGYWAEDINLWHLTTTKVMPDSFEYATNGGRKYLLRNLGKDKAGKWLGFADVTEAMGLTGRRWTLAVAAADLCGTGYPDLVLANDYGVNEFYANHGGEKFVEMGKKTGVGDRPKSGMSVSFGDVFNQGRLCVYTTNISEPGILLQLNNLWVPDKDQTGDDLRYTNQADTLGVARGGWSWGAQFGDLNNDGRLDLVLTNGYISAERHSSYWYDYNQIAGAHKVFINDAANWPAIMGKSLAGYQQHCLWLNRGGRFNDVAQAIGFRDTHDGRAVVLVDLWNRGVLDVVEANQKGPLLVYKNTVAKENNWIQFALTGTRSNRSAIGAQVKVYWKGEVQVQEVSGGSGYAAQNERRLHFGLGKDAQVERVVIQWPSGETQTLTAPAVNKLHPITEPS